MLNKVINLNKVNYQKLGFFRFKKLGKDYLLTNDIGNYLFLKPEEFKKFLEGKLNKENKIYKQLKEKYFLAGEFNTEDLAGKYAQKNSFLIEGPSLHIIITTLRCNFKCCYCQASSKSENSGGYDMDKETAKKAVDIAFSSPNKYLAIEFQGGEPLLNYEVVKFIVEYSRGKEKKEKKDLQIRLVSNFSLLDEKKLKFFFDHKVYLCTSLDGPEKLHNKNRPWPKGNSYQAATKYLKKAMKMFREKERAGYLSMPGALVTLSRDSLKYPYKIVDEYLKWGFESIFFRPTTRLGIAGKLWEKIGYSAEEYLNFYKKALNYIIEINKKGKFFYEQNALVMLHKIFSSKDPGMLDLRSPCGAGIGQMVYNYNGKIYTCDEGRMVAEMGDEAFLIGKINKNKYQKILSHQAVKTLVTASCLDNNICDLCVYKPYCGVCPVRSYAEEGNLFPEMPCNDRCRINKGILDFIFEKLKDKKTEKIFKSWLSR